MHNKRQLSISAYSCPRVVVIGIFLKNSRVYAQIEIVIPLAYLYLLKNTKLFNPALALHTHSWSWPMSLEAPDGLCKVLEYWIYIITDNTLASTFHNFFFHQM
jgi:hypothetical protein